MGRAEGVVTRVRGNRGRLRGDTGAGMRSGAGGAGMRNGGVVGGGVLWGWISELESSE